MEAIERRVSSLFLIPLVSLFVAVLLLIALLYGQRDLTIVSLMLFGVIAGTRLWTRWSLTGIECRLSVDKSRTFPDEKILLRAFAENRKILPVWLQVTVPIGGLSQHARTSASAPVVVETGLLWYQKTQFEWELSAQKRGVHRIGPLHILTGDLFGFFPKAAERTEAVEVIVYPRLVPVKTPPLPRRDFFGIPGADNPVKDPIYILGTRDYQQGRPAKYIHWKATARHHKLQEKIFEPTEQEKIVLVVDVDQFARHKAEEEFEAALETAASVAVLLERRGCSVGLVTNGLMTGGGESILPVTRNPQQLTAVLEALARLQMESGGELIETMRAHLRLPWGTSCLYFAHARDSKTEACGEFFARRRVPVLYFVSALSSASVKRMSGTGGTTYALEEIRVVEAHG